MRCAWQELLNVLPIRLREQTDTIGKESLQELRMRLGQPVQLVCADGELNLQDAVNAEDLTFVVNAASKYSPWAAQSTRLGYLTARGGHRIGLCGEAVVDGGRCVGIRKVTSLCIRVARDFPGIAAAMEVRGSILILGPPGWGKTTLLRDLIRQRSDSGTGSICVVDERGELFPHGFQRGRRTDVLTGCSKSEGVPMALRTMGPGTVAVDEITAPEDANAILEAIGCGVHILATAHGASVEDLYRRPEYRVLMEAKAFQTVIILQQDKSWRTERI